VWPTVTDRSFAPSTLSNRGLDPNAGNRFRREAIRKGIYPFGAGRGGPMELQCPNCRSTDLKKASLAYQEGLQHVSTRTRLRGVVVGSDGPDVFVGRATTKGTQQTENSKALTPPKKWSYAKLFGRSTLAFLMCGWIVFYLNTITNNSSSVSSLPLTVFALLSAFLLVVIFFLYWNHNHSTYPRKYAKWDRSFICNRCGVVCDQDDEITLSDRMG
jgi:hypothetical protein